MRNKKAVIILIILLSSFIFSLYMVISSFAPDIKSKNKAEASSEEIKSKSNPIKDEEEKDPEEYVDIYTGASKENYLYALQGVKKKIDFSLPSDKKAQRIYFQFMTDETDEDRLHLPEFTGLKEGDMLAYFVDLNDDGVDEIIGDTGSNYFRGNYCKDINILKKNNQGKYIEMNTLSVATWSDIEIMNHKTNGYHDIKYDVIASGMPAEMVITQYKNGKYLWEYKVNNIISKDKGYSEKAYNFKVKRKDYTNKKEGVFKRIDFKKKPDSLASEILYEFHKTRYGDSFGDVYTQSDVKGYFVDMNDDGVEDIIGEINRYRSYDKEKKKYKTTEIIVRRSDGWETLLTWVLYEADYIDVLNSKTNGYHNFIHTKDNKSEKFKFKYYGYTWDE